MNFLQPLMLAALPLASLPIIIHLINQRRFQTIRWGAMMFLLSAQQMSRGYSRLRRWLIMLARTLSIVGLIFAISRPLSSGWLGYAAGGMADVTLILLDRSASMQQFGEDSSVSKLETCRQQLARTLSMFRSSRWILIESTNREPREIESPDKLLTLSATEATSASADIPGMLEAARDFIESNKVGRAEVWICSDLRSHDWNPESGRWKTLRETFAALPQGVRIHLLAYSRSADGNVGVRVSDLKRVGGEQPALLVSLKVTQSAEEIAPKRIPIQFDIGGGKSVIEVDLDDREYEMKDHWIPLGPNKNQGWGTVSIPADVNPADNTYYLAYGTPPERRTLIVAEDEGSLVPLKLVTEIAAEPEIQCVSEVVPQEQLPAVEWEKAATVLWKGRLPEGNDAELLRDFVTQGGTVILFPPKSPTTTSFAGLKWDKWFSPQNSLKVESWRSDEDLLSKTMSGSALPVGDLVVRRFCPPIASDQTASSAIPLASLSGGIPLLLRVPTDRGGIYYCSTTPEVEDSNLSSNGVVLYVMIQRTLASGSERLESVRMLTAGELKGEEIATWEQLSGIESIVPEEYSFHSGVYSADDRRFVVNRPMEEDSQEIVEDEELKKLFAGLDFTRVDAVAGQMKSLIQEIWHFFMGTLILALVLEAALCLPNREKKASIEPKAMGAIR